MTTHKIAIRLAELCRTGQYAQAHKELYADNAISIEPEHALGLTSVQGLENIIKKGEQFQSAIEKVHSGYASEPIIAGNHIAIAMGVDVTIKGRGRQNMEEVGVYEVKDGKIVKEQFFY